MKKLPVTLLLFGSSAFAITVIDTLPQWSALDYTSYVDSWDGSGNGSDTFGQTVTVPTDGDVYLNSFTFYINTQDPIPAQGYVYSWDSVTNRAISEVWASNQFTVPATPPAEPEVFAPVTLTPGVKLDAGQQYVLFFTAATLPPGSSYSQWAGNSDSLPPDGEATDWYSGGGFFFLNSGGDSSTLTTTSWDTYPFPGSDLAFKAQFDATGPTPEPSTLAMGLLPLAALVVYRRRRI